MGVIRKATFQGMLKRLSLDDDPSARRQQDRRTIIRKRPAWTALAESL